MSTHPSRRALRQEMSARRRTVPPGPALKAARALATAAFRLPLLARARHVGCYLPVRGEMDTAPLIAEAWRRGQRVWLPVLEGERLLFAPYGADTPLCTNRFGIPEPDVPRGRRRSARALDVVLAPLLAFDRDGHRLGMGGGYYDRTLGFRHGRVSYHRPWFVGLAFSFQEVPALAAEPWDVPLDAVITESGSRRCTPSAGAHR